jgi:hypothetical protein
LRRLTAAALFSIGLVVLMAQQTGHAQQGTDPLPYSGGFLVTGNYVVGGVDLNHQNNPTQFDATLGLSFSTGFLNISGVPDNADILGAYLYWETVHLTGVSNPEVGVKFDDHDVNDPSIPIPLVKSSAELPLTGGSCYGSGGQNQQYRLTMFKTDVLRFLPKRSDSTGASTGKRVVNGNHKVRLPQGNGNNPPESAGATLFVVYRDPEADRTLNPLRKIVVYDFANGDPNTKPYIQPTLGTITTQTLRGFYRSSAATLSQGVSRAKVSYVVASSQPNVYERVFFNDLSSGQYPPNNQPILTNPFGGGSSSERSWSALQPSDVSALMSPGNNSGGTPNYGETAKTTIDHLQGGGYDCLTLGAVFFSAAVADDEHDGIPDGLERPNATATHPLSDPDGTELPDLAGMGARSSNPAQKDMFVEVQAFKAPPNTTYGSYMANCDPLTNKFCAPYNATASIASVTDSVGHDHMPLPSILNAVADVYALVPRIGRE